jgi:hypothetical protein
MKKNLLITFLFIIFINIAFSNQGILKQKKIYIFNADDCPLKIIKMNNSTSQLKNKLIIDNTSKATIINFVLSGLMYYQSGELLGGMS